MILDTVAVSGLLEGDRELVARLAGCARLHFPVIVLGELRYGLMSSRLRTTLEPQLDALVATGRVLAVTERTTPFYAGLRHQLRRSGSPIPANDAWIVALALEHDLPVVTRDAHFDVVEGVSVVGW